MEQLQKLQSMSSACQFLVLMLCYISESVHCVCPDEGDHWSGWWSYGGVSGPDHWGDHRQAWSICKSGRNQSPINILPETLLYDPHLKNLQIDYTKVDGILKNTKKDITFTVNNSSGNYINITSGPLSYTYRLNHIKFHFSYRDSPGSEHRIDGKAFRGELHLIAYNADIYANYTVASSSPRGIAIIAVFLSVGAEKNKAFDIFREKFVTIEQKGTCTDIEGLPIEGLIPKTEHYMTYSGSLTQPGCQETVTWIIYNKPLFLSEHQMRDLRSIPYQEWRDSNARPVQPLNHRTVRTNINFRKRTRLCTMEAEKSYQANPQLGN